MSVVKHKMMESDCYIGSKKDSLVNMELVQPAVNTLEMAYTKYGSEI